MKSELFLKTNCTFRHSRTCNCFIERKQNCSAILPQWKQNCSGFLPKKELLDFNTKKTKTGQVSPPLAPMHVAQNLYGRPGQIEANGRFNAVWVGS
jgi:hypothetical protein